MSFSPGDPAPFFKAPTASTPEFQFDTAAGRYVLLLFAPTDEMARYAALKQLAAHQALFDDARATAFVVLRASAATPGVRDLRGLRWVLDDDNAVSRLFDAVDADGREQAFWLALDPTLRVLWQKPADAAEEAFQAFARLPPPGEHAGVVTPAPVLVAPRIFEPELCRTLIERHETLGSAFTGVMRDHGDVTIAVMDELKKRRDLRVDDPGLEAALKARLEQRLFPLIARALAFEATHIERYLISCYDAEDGGVFHAHRDNTTFQTAHRKFACSINLNDDYRGGDLRFPEFGLQTYRPPVGGAVVFACGLLHEVTRVTAGRRYAFVPFFFDAAGATVRAAYDARVAARSEPPV